MTNGIWIWENDTPRNDEYADFAEKFSVREGEAVSLRISADSFYAVYVNGILAAFGQYADLPHCKVVDTHDISAYCKKGENNLLITVWYHGSPCSTYCPDGQAGVFFELSANDRLIAASGEHTLCRPNPYYVQHTEKYITQSIGLSFHYNAAGKELPYHAAAPTGYAPELHERPILPLTLEDLRPGVIIGGDSKTHFLLDIGREDAGFIALSLKSDTEQTITVAYGEHIDGGYVHQKIARRDFSIQYSTVVGENMYMNPFRRLGCRYLEIFCEHPIHLRYAGIRPTNYPLTPIPFNAGSPLRQQIYETCLRTLALCMHEHYEDCPWREQSMFAGDGRNEMMAAYYGFGETRFTRACLWLYAQDRREDGFLATCIPSYSSPLIPSFGLHWYQGIYEYLTNTGDENFVREIWGKMCSVLDAYMPYYNEKRNLLYCPPDDKYWNFYEWAGTHLIGGAGAKENPNRADLPLNCLFLRALKIMNTLSARLSLPFALTHLTEPLRAGIRKAFRREDGLYNTYENMEHICEFGNALAVLTDVAEVEDAEVICRVLSGREKNLPIVKVPLDESGNMRISDVLDSTEGVIPVIGITLSMTTLVYDALLKTDREKYKDFVLTDIDRRWGGMLDTGATSFWETMLGWKGFGNAGSLCHGWSATPIYYYRTLL